jgi:hypothetical protein
MLDGERRAVIDVTHRQKAAHTHTHCVTLRD